MKVSEASNILERTYLYMAKQELANTPKTKHKEIVRCCKCKNSQTTLRKLNGEYLCIRCYKEK
jgi:formylmethanofuran dehydrogenase subunit E